MFKNRHALRRIAVVGLAGAAAYLGARHGIRSTQSGIADLTQSVSEVAFYARRDYWAVYQQAQSDLLREEDL